MKSFGCIAYEAYYESSLGKSLVSGAELPAWQDLSIEISNFSALPAADVQPRQPSSNFSKNECSSLLSL